MSHDHSTHDHTRRCFWAYDEARWVCRPAPVRQPERGELDALFDMLQSNDDDRRGALVTA